MEKICGYHLDNQQQAIVLDESKYLLVVAGAGSGKTFTILGKINYLIKYKNILPEEILCVSFTRESANSLKAKIKCEFGIDMPVYTFHKLSLEILSSGGIDYSISDSNLLDDIVDSFFRTTILKSKLHMKLVLRYFNVGYEKNIEAKYNNYYKRHSDNFIVLGNLIKSFIRLFKCNNYKIEDYITFSKLIRRTIFYKNYRCEKTLLILILNIYLIYENYLKDNNEIDFDDMIIKASKYVEEKGIAKSFKYIIIDEYQDTSYIRFKLIDNIINKTNASLMVVGDDFQSIYSFTGCDISLFINFKDYFNGANIMKIENTYRNSQELISAAGSFVMKNPHQIKKNLISKKSIKRPIKVVYCNNLKKAFSKLIIDIKNNSSILVLGRNNKDINLVLGDEFKILDDGTIKCLNNSDIKVRYLTVHKSKGLEADNVIIINLEDSYLGFPSKLKDDRLLRLVSKESDKFSHSEERRLFYVALTRTKNNVYLLVNKHKSSIFVKELIRDYRNDIEIINYKL